MENKKIKINNKSDKHDNIVLRDHEIIEKCWKAVSANVNTSLSLSAMCGEIFEII